MFYRSAPRAGEVCLRSAESPTRESASAELPQAGLPPVGVGVASAVLGGVGMLLFILPVIGIPISIAGLVLGLVGCLASLGGTRVSLRLSITGVVLSSIALGGDAAVAWAPAGYLPNSRVQQMIEPIPGRPYVPPPASVDP
jgi:hypothetical protein